METKAAPLTERPAWKALGEHYQKIRDVHLRTLFGDDPKRGERFAAEAAGLYLDYSKHRITDETMRLLLALAEEAGLRARIDAMFAGEKINVTERRAVLHVALRAPRGASIMVDGKNVVPEVHEVLDRMAEFSRRVRDGSWTGPHRQAHPQRHQYRNRRLGPRAGDGLRGAAPLQRSQSHRALRLQRRWHRLRRGDARPRRRPKRCSSSRRRPSPRSRP